MKNVSFPVALRLFCRAKIKGTARFSSTELSQWIAIMTIRAFCMSNFHGGSRRCYTILLEYNASYLVLVKQQTLEGIDTQLAKASGLIIRADNKC